MNHRKAEKLKNRARADFDKGLSINAFLDIEPKQFGLKRLDERARAVYETGWRVRKREVGGNER